MEQDNSRPFGQGSVVLLPGSSSYLGDLPHRVTLFGDSEVFNPMDRWLGVNVGWFEFSNSPPSGFRLGSPGLFFEGIPYPFSSAKILVWLPVNASAQFLDFPASAWWGTGAASGAVQLKPPDLNRKSSDQYSLWGGGAGILGAADVFKSLNGSFDLNIQRGEELNPNTLDRFGLQSKVRWLGSESLDLESGFLGAQNSNAEYWYSFFTSLSFLSGDFQTLQIKPYFQSAENNGERQTELGGFLNYHFNMGGVAETHLGLGYSRVYIDSTGSAGNRGFVQGTALGDVLGMATLDAAFRFDFADSSNPLFSYLLGLQGSHDDLTFFGDLGKSPMAGPLDGLSRFDAGLRWQPGDYWTSTLQYIRREAGGASWNGGYFSAQFIEARPLLLVLKRMAFMIEEQLVVDQAGAAQADTGAKLAISFFKQDTLYIRARAFADHPVYLEAGGRYQLTKEIGVFLALANLTEVPIFWIDLPQDQGRVFRAGISGQF